MGTMVIPQFEESTAWTVSCQLVQLISQIKSKMQTEIVHNPHGITNAGIGDESYNHVVLLYKYHHRHAYCFDIVPDSLVN
jgi:hypothetical protein